MIDKSFFSDTYRKARNIILTKKNNLNVFLHNQFYEKTSVKCRVCGDETKSVGLKKPFLGTYYLASVILPYGLLLNLVFLPLSIESVLKYGIIYYFVAEELPRFLNKCIPRGK